MGYPVGSIVTKAEKAIALSPRGGGGGEDYIPHC